VTQAISSTCVEQHFLERELGGDKIIVVEIVALQAYSGSRHLMLSGH
jgi:hypothetical protein